MKKIIVALIAISLVASNVFAFDLPWRLKEFSSFDSCMNFVPKFQGQQEISEAACKTLFFRFQGYSRDFLIANKKFFSCIRTRVEKVSSPSEGRASVNKCAEDYPPTENTLPMQWGIRFFPTPEEAARWRSDAEAVANRRREADQQFIDSQEQIRRNIRESERRSRELDRAFRETNRTECITIGNDISCF